MDNVNDAINIQKITEFYYGTFIDNNCIKTDDDIEGFDSETNLTQNIEQEEKLKYAKEKPSEEVNPSKKTSKWSATKNKLNQFCCNYPTSVKFILGSELCERFCYFGLKAVLSLYLKNILEYSEKQATAVIHLFIVFCYMLPLAGAVIADSYLGKYWTIVVLSIVYCVGTTVLLLGSIHTIGSQRLLTWIGLCLISCGTGGIKPCISAFGGNQFKLPEQAKQLALFFSMFYFIINVGSLMSSMITPCLRKIKCLGNDSCYCLSFGIPTIFCYLALVIFMCGKPTYVIVKPEGNLFVKVLGCIMYALRMKFTCNKKNKRSYWLDYASDKYSEELIADIKALCAVSVVFIPAPFFWAVFDQQSSTWVFQAEKMNGQVGRWSVMPEQLQVANPILVLTFVPIMQIYGYPFFEKLNILKTPLQKFGLGLILAAFSFGISAGLEFIIIKHSGAEISIFWQLPQIIVLAFGELLFSVQALEFCYTQAPMEMKSLVNSLWYLTTAVGNMLVFTMAHVNVFPNKAYELLFYSFLLWLDFIFFLCLAKNFKYREQEYS